MVPARRDMRVVVAGGGRVGFRVAQLLDEYGHDPVVVERDSDRCAAIGDTHTAIVIDGDASQRSILEEADVRRSDAVAALTGDGATNLAVCATARVISGATRTVARADSAATAEREATNDYVDAVVFPEHAGARMALTRILGQGYGDLAAFPEGFESTVLQVGEDSPIAGKQVREVRFPVGSRVVGDVTRSVVLTNKTTFEPGNEYLVALDRDVAEEVRQLFEG